MNKTTDCIYCGKTAKLKEDGLRIKKGLVDVNVPCSNYECTVCKRTFKTTEQNMETASGILKHNPKMQQEPDRGTRRG